MVTRDRVADALKPERIETDERDREAGPELLLELRQHALLRNHQDATSAAALDELGRKDAGLECLTQADRVGD